MSGGAVKQQREPAREPRRGDSEESGEDDEGAAANGGAARRRQPLPPGWQAVESADGTYYWHTATNSVTWEPAGLASSEPCLSEYGF